jgi:hypothetical protein
VVISNYGLFIPAEMSPGTYWIAEWAGLRADLHFLEDVKCVGMEDFAIGKQDL